MSEQLRKAAEAAVAGWFEGRTPNKMKPLIWTLRAALAAQPVTAQGWRPIELAPMDGTTTLGFWAPKDGVVHGGCYATTCFAEGTWCSPEDSDDFYVPPTLWHPLPVPPEAGGTPETAQDHRSRVANATTESPKTAVSAVPGVAQAEIERLQDEIQRYVGFCRQALIHIHRPGASIVTEGYILRAMGAPEELVQKAHDEAKALLEAAQAEPAASAISRHQINAMLGHLAAGLYARFPAVVTAEFTAAMVEIAAATPSPAPAVGERSIIDPSRSAKDMRRFAALWRYGSQVLPGESASTRAFDSWLFQLDMLIDSKTHGLPFEECPSIAPQAPADGGQWQKDAQS